MRWSLSRLRAPLGALLLVTLSSCGGDKKAPTEVEEPVATSITVSPAVVTLDYINQRRALSAQVRDQNGQPFSGTVTWESDDTTVVEVGVTGSVIARANGVANVTASIGALEATAVVTVQQVLRSLLPAPGVESQEAVFETAVPNAITLRGTDAAGTPVEGATVTFTPDAGNGSVSVASAVSDADGEVSTVWTLGTPFGRQRLVASTDGGAEVEIFAWSRDVTPTPDLVADDDVVFFRADPSSLERFQVRNLVRNEGDGASGAFTVRVLADGLDVGSESFGPLDRDAEEIAIVEVGPLAPGQRQLTVQIDANDDVQELIESNNEAGEPLGVVLQSEVAPGPTTGLALPPDGELLYRLTVPPGAPSVLTISLNGGNGDADLFIERTARPAARSGYDSCVSAGPVSVERCQLQDPEGEYHIIVHAAQDSAFSDLTMDVTLDDNLLPFELELDFVESGTPTQNEAFQKAADRWSQLLVGDLPDQIFTSVYDYPADLCISGQGQVTETIDDVRIYVSIRFIDGPLGVLARAATCVRRYQTELPVMGFMQFDQADLERLELDGDMDNVVLHEMGHILGIGTLWQARRLLESPSINNPGADTHFRGPRAIAAFDAVGGATYTAGAKVPVENLAGPGSSDGHWRESVFDHEMMSPFLDAGVFNPLSIVTVESLADLGYLVDVTQADPYTLPGQPAAAALSPTAGEIDLSNDIAWGPVAIVDEKGRIVEIRHEGPPPPRPNR